MNGAQSLLKVLTDAGLDTCFTNPGTSEMQLVYEMGRAETVRAVLCLQEATATGAADGYARMAARPAFTLLHVGSGFANGIANLHNAGRANSGVVNVVGANATYHQHNFPEHELINGRITDLARVVSHSAQEARTASQLAVLGAVAARDAKTGRVCTVVAPTDCHWDPAGAVPAPLPPVELPRVSREAVEEIAALLKNGKRTALLLGKDALHGEGLELAGRIAARTGAFPLAEVLVPRLARGEGRVPVQLIPYLSEMAMPLLQPFAQLVLVGAPLPVTTFAYQGSQLVKVPAGCQVTTFATNDMDIVAALRDLAAAVDALSLEGARQSRTQSTPPTGALNADAIGQSLCVLMPENAILVNEGITLGLPIFQRTQGARAHEYLDAGCGGALGAGMPVALGAAVACPNRKTVLLQGDGAGMYAIQALWSLAREKANVIVIVLKNNQYAILEVELARVSPDEANDKMLSTMRLDGPTLDWVKLAEGHGVSATRATTAEEFHQQFEAALASVEPQLIEARCADSIQPFVDLVRRSRWPQS
jgi:acetolactate synthase-1/2/3 large subunit